MVAHGDFAIVFVKRHHDDCQWGTVTRTLTGILGKSSVVSLGSTTCSPRVSKPSWSGRAADLSARTRMQIIQRLESGGIMMSLELSSRVEWNEDVLWFYWDQLREVFVIVSGSAILLSYFMVSDLGGGLSPSRRFACSCQRGTRHLRLGHSDGNDAHPSRWAPASAELTNLNSTPTKNAFSTSPQCGYGSTDPRPPARYRRKLLIWVWGLGGCGTIWTSES
jgi:hypothetical protein